MTKRINTRPTTENQATTSGAAITHERDPATQQLLDCMIRWSLEWRDEPDGTPHEAVSRILGDALARIEELEAALKPFAEASDRIDKDQSVWFDHDTHWSGGDAGLTVGDLRAARAAWFSLRKLRALSLKTREG